MFFKNNFDTIALVKNGVILSLKTKQWKILFSELDSINISAHKVPTIYEFLLVIFLIGLATLSLLYLPRDLILIMPLLIIITIYIKFSTYKSYELNIRLKNGALLKKRVPLKLKHETIDLVQDIRKEIFDYKIHH